MRLGTAAKSKPALSKPGRRGGRKRTPEGNLNSFFQKLGPGLVTGASDDDPSGIGTYSQVGAQFGYAMLWTMLFSYPLMAAIQEISARIGRGTSKGIAANIRNHYPRSILFATLVLLFGANTINLVADLGAMWAVVAL